MTLRHTHKDQYMCRKQSGVGIGMVCDKCDGRCIVCDGYTNPLTLVRLCDDCSFGPNKTKCIMCGSSRASNEAYYCRECTVLEKDRDGCPRIMAVSSQKRDAHHKLKTGGT